MGSNRIGLFGGSFDPVHSAHVMVARRALDELQLDRLFIVPAARSPFKPEQQLAPDDVRLPLLKAAFKNLDGCEIDHQEIQREGVSYTIETARDFARRFPDAELFYLIGADHVSTLAEWWEADALAKLLIFVVVPRLGGLEADVPTPFRTQYLGGDPMNISSSEVRLRLRKGEPIDHLVPPAVDKIISELRVYQ